MPSGQVYFGWFKYRHRNRNIYSIGGSSNNTAFVFVSIFFFATPVDPYQHFSFICKQRFFGRLRTMAMWWRLFDLNELVDVMAVGQRGTKEKWNTKKNHNIIVDFTHRRAYECATIFFFTLVLNPMAEMWASVIAMGIMIRQLPRGFVCFYFEY